MTSTQTSTPQRPTFSKPPILLEDTEARYEPTWLERQAMLNVKTALRNLPRTLHMTVDVPTGTVQFWRRDSAYLAEKAGPDFKCKKAFNIRRD